MDTVNLGRLTVSRLILGSNPFSGFSHLSPLDDVAMKRYYTTEKIKATLRQAESLGINTLIARTDHHVMRFLLEYWDEGGGMQWFAQTCPEVGDHFTGVSRATSSGAKACHIHGGVMDYLYAQGKLAEIPPVIQLIRDNGMLAGIAAHNPKVIEWAEENLDVDYYMCSYYNAAHRDQRAEHVSGMEEWFLEEDRQVMTTLIRRLSRPVIHYKVFAAGRNDPAEAFKVVAQTMRPDDMVCIGVYTKDHPDMLREDAELFEAQRQAAAMTFTIEKSLD
ncbi:MAG: hypothetical protein H6Q37_1706 [Chloroflexi bacterium]|nr:hypothetical protein [Chloroflexota bacterium]